MGSHPGPSRGLGTGLRATLLVALAAASLVRFLGVGTFRYSDASRHAMDGVFVLDVLRHLPQALRSPWEYAADYYAHYPALGFFFYYPPLFAVVEAVFFKLFGVSAATARLAVAATFSLGIGVWFWFLRRLMGDFYAFCACLLLLGIPQTVHTGRMVMLEPPTVALAMAALCAFWLFAEEGQERAGWWWAALTVGAVFCKQTAAFLVPVFGLWLLLRGRLQLLRRPQGLAWLGGVSLLVLPYLLIVVSTARLLREAHAREGMRELVASGGRVLHLFVHQWVELFGVPGAVLAAACLGIVLVALWRGWRTAGFQGLILIYVLSFSLQSAALRGISARYGYFLLPVLSALPFLQLASVRPRPAGAAKVALLAICGALYLHAYRLPVPYLLGSEEMARIVCRVNDRPFVLYDGYFDGDFIFCCRRFQEGGRRFYVLRGDRTLYSFASQREFYYREHLKDPEQIWRFLQRLGVRFVVVEEPDCIDNVPSRSLRALLRGPLFRLVAEVPLRGRGRRIKEGRLQLYECLGAPPAPRPGGFLIPLPGLGRGIWVSVDATGGVHSAFVDCARGS